MENHKDEETLLAESYMKSPNSSRWVGEKYRTNQKEIYMGEDRFGVV